MPITGEADGLLSSDKVQEAGVAREKAKEREAGQERKDGFLRSGADKELGAGQTLNGFNRRTGLRDRGYRCDSEYHVAP